MDIIFINYVKFSNQSLYSLDVHPSRELVASGQRAGVDRKSQAHVRIWSTDSLQTLYVFGMGEFIDGVTAVNFSQLVNMINTIDSIVKMQIIIIFIPEWWKLHFGYGC